MRDQTLRRNALGAYLGLQMAAGHCHSEKSLNVSLTFLYCDYTFSEVFLAGLIPSQLSGGKATSRDTNFQFRF